MTIVSVLVAEDEPVLRAALADLVSGDPSLELAGSAPDADEAIRIARARRPDVALVDVRMPGGGGPRATREICAGSPATKVLALSANDDRDSVLGMLRAGAVGYLLTSVSSEALTRAITQAAAGQAILSRGVTASVIEELVTLLNRSEELGEELKDLDRTKSELVQILSHELRTPVTVIQGAFMTLADADNLSSEQITVIFDGVMRATSRLTRLSANVAAAARLGHIGRSIETQSVSVDELIGKATSEFPQEKDLLVLPAEHDGTLETISANLDLATRAIVLVIENALDVSPERRSVEMQVRAGPGTVEIHVSDRGPGVPEKLRDRIFEPFAQVDSSITRPHQGMGMGLFLARRVMEAHRGKLEMRPRPGGGSTFVLVFPALHGGSAMHRGEDLGNPVK